MKYLKIFEEYKEDFNNKYHLDDFYFTVSNGGPTEGVEVGEVTLKFDKDGEEIYCEFEVYQLSSKNRRIQAYYRNSGAKLDDKEVAESLGIELDDRNGVVDKDLLSEILDCYGNHQNEGEWNGMEYSVEDVSPNGVVECGWLLIEIHKGDEIEEVQIDIEQDATGNYRVDEVELDSDEDTNKLKSLGIQFDEDFQDALLRAYDDYSNFLGDWTTIR